jgi:hypothetical protein
VGSFPHTARTWGLKDCSNKRRVHLLPDSVAALGVRSGDGGMWALQRDPRCLTSHLESMQAAMALLVIITLAVCACQGDAPMLLLGQQAGREMSRASKSSAPTCMHCALRARSDYQYMS